MQRLFFGKSGRRPLLQTVPQCSCFVDPSTYIPSSNCLKFMSGKEVLTSPHLSADQSKLEDLVFKQIFHFFELLPSEMFLRLLLVTVSRIYYT